MAKNKPSSFGAADDLSFPLPTNRENELKEDTNRDLKQVQEVQEVQEVVKKEEYIQNKNIADTQEVHEIQKEIGTTQGKKGQKLKRINMAFSDVNHEYVTKESRRRGISATAFVNMIIDEYRDKL